MGRREAVQTGEDSILDAVELRQSLYLVGQGVLYLGEVVFDFHNVACEGNESIGEGTNIGIEVFVVVVVEVGETRLEATNLWLEFVGDGHEGSTRFFCRLSEAIVYSCEGG